MTNNFRWQLARFIQYFFVQCTEAYLRTTAAEAIAASYSILSIQDLWTPCKNNSKRVKKKKVCFNCFLIQIRGPSETFRSVYSLNSVRIKFGKFLAIVLFQEPLWCDVLFCERSGWLLHIFCSKFKRKYFLFFLVENLFRSSYNSKIVKTFRFQIVGIGLADEMGMKRANKTVICNL